MNVIGSRPDGWWKDRHAAMVRLVAQLDGWAMGHGEPVTVVFERPPSTPIPSGVVDVHYAPRPAANSGDDEIVRLICAADHRDRITVVTSDQSLQARVRAAGATVTAAGAFRAVLDDTALW